MIRILMIEDDIQLANLLKRYLANEDFETTIALDPLNGLEILQNTKHGFDALILDLSLPNMDGLEVCMQVRRTHPNLPVIISSARSDILDKAKGFEVGADDYMVKPYDPLELIFRLRAVLKRGLTAIQEKQTFAIDRDRYIFKKNGEDISMPRAEYDIFAFLFEREGFVVSREDLLLNVSSIKFQSGSKSIDVMVGRLRQRIGDDPKNPRYIHSVRGVGYKFINA